MSDTLDKAQRLLTDLLDFVYPSLCLGCAQHVEADQPICERCLRMIDTYDRPLCLRCNEIAHRGHSCPVCKAEGFLLYSYGDYHEPMAAIIKQLKFKGVTWPARFFSEKIVERLGPQLEAFDADFLIPIPLHRSREYARGYNQAQIVAEGLSDGLHIEIDNGLLVRHRARKPQAKLKSSDREANIADVFRVSEPCTTTTRLILVDDVVTTGSTVNEARRVLTEAGYEVPAVIAIAK